MATIPFTCIEGYPEDYNDAGHFVFVASSGSGKTYYTKWLVSNLVKGMPPLEDGTLPIYVFCSEGSVHDWQTTEASGEYLVPQSHVFTTYTPGQLKELKLFLYRHDSLHHSKSRSVVIFDDFAEVLSYRSSEFSEAITTFRHSNAKIIAISHTATAAPPVARENVSHVLFGATSSVELIRKLAGMYMMGDSISLKEAFKKLPRYAFIKLNLNNRTYHIHAAPPPDKTGLSTASLDIQGAGSSSAQIAGVGVGMRTAVVSGGTYNDASRNIQNVMVNNDTKVMLDQSRVQIQIRREQLEVSRAEAYETARHNDMLQSFSNRLALKNLLLQPYLQEEDRDKAVRLLAIEMGDPSINSLNIFTGGRDVAFMRKHFPQEGYTARDPTVAAITSYTPAALALARNDTVGLVQEAFRGGALQTVAGYFGLARAAPKPPSQSEISRKKLRDMIVFRPMREEKIFSRDFTAEALIRELRPCMRRPEVLTEKNVWENAMELLEKYYPEDFEEEKRIFILKMRRRQARAAVSQ